MSYFNDKRFGLEQAMQCAIKNHKALGTIRSGLYVPTEHEVKTLPPDSLKPILIDWFWESPTELIPHHAQVEAVKTLLSSRDDAERCATLIAECDEYLSQPSNK